MEVQKQALSVREAGAVVGCSADSMRRFIAAGQVRAIRVGRLVRVPRAEIERVLRDGVGPHAAKSGRAK